MKLYPFLAKNLGTLSLLLFHCWPIGVMRTGMNLVYLINFLSLTQCNMIILLEQLEFSHLGYSCGRVLRTVAWANYSMGINKNHSSMFYW